MDNFFQRVSPNPAAAFAFANLVLLTLATLVPEPNHLGRLLHPQRHFNGTGWLHRLHYALWMPSACVTSSIIAALQHPSDKRFWVEVLRYVDPPFGKKDMECPTKVYCLSLKPTQHADATASFSEENAQEQTIKMLVYSEAQALIFFTITAALHESYLNLLFLAPLAIKLLAFVSGPVRHGLYHTGASTDDKNDEEVFTRRSTVPELGIVVVRGHEFYVRQFGRLGSYGQIKDTSSGRNISDIARQTAQKLSILLSIACHGLSVGLFLRFVNWTRQDLIPWLWLLQQSTAVFAWTVSRLVGFADIGRTEYLLGEALSEQSHAVLAGKKSYLGVKASLHAKVVDGREQVETAIMEFERNFEKTCDVGAEKSEVLPEKQPSVAASEIERMESQTPKAVDRSESSGSTLFDSPGEGTAITIRVIPPEDSQTEETGSELSKLIHPEKVASKTENTASTPIAYQSASAVQDDTTISLENRPVSPEFIPVASDSSLGAGVNSIETVKQIDCNKEAELGSA